MVLKWCQLLVWEASAIKYIVYHRQKIAAEAPTKMAIFQEAAVRQTVPEIANLRWYPGLLSFVVSRLEMNSVSLASSRFNRVAVRL